MWQTAVPFALANDLQCCSTSQLPTTLSHLLVTLAVALPRLRHLRFVAVGAAILRAVLALGQLLLHCRKLLLELLHDRGMLSTARSGVPYRSLHSIMSWSPSKPAPKCCSRIGVFTSRLKSGGHTGRHLCKSAVCVTPSIHGQQ